MSSLRLICRNAVSENLFTKSNGGKFGLFKQIKTTFSDQPASKPTSEKDINVHHHSVSNFDKMILVWVKKYKTKEDIPNEIPYATVVAAKDRARVKASNYFILFAVIGLILSSFQGRKAHERGESVQKMNMDWHKEMEKKISEDEVKKLQKN